MGQTKYDLHTPYIRLRPKEHTEAKGRREEEEMLGNWQPQMQGEVLPDQFANKVLLQ